MAKKKIKKDHRIKGGKEKLALMKGGLESMSYKDAKRRAIVLGMPFPDVVAGDWNSLGTFIMNSENKPDSSLIHQYDEWMDTQMELAGYGPEDPMRHYMLRMGYVSEDKEANEKKAKRVKGIPKTPKPKREKDENNLWKGTKKSYTFELTRKGYDLERIKRRVIKKFPDANEKSVQQWYRAAIRKQEE